MGDEKKARLIELLCSIIGAKVKYSRCGGSVSSIILQYYYDDPLDCELWIWCYWDIEKYDRVIACSEDDDTPVVGVMATASRGLEEKSVIGFTLYENYVLGLYFSDSSELWICPVEYDEEFKDLNNWELLSHVRHYKYKLDSHHQLQEEYFEK